MPHLWLIVDDTTTFVDDSHYLLYDPNGGGAMESGAGDDLGPMDEAGAMNADGLGPMEDS